MPPIRIIPRHPESICTGRSPGRGQPAAGSRREGARGGQCNVHAFSQIPPQSAIHPGGHNKTRRRPYRKTRVRKPFSRRRADRRSPTAQELCNPHALRTPWVEDTYPGSLQREQDLRDGRRLRAWQREGPVLPRQATADSRDARPRSETPSLSLSLWRYSPAYATINSP